MAICKYALGVVEAAIWLQPELHPGPSLSAQMQMHLFEKQLHAA